MTLSNTTARTYAIGTAVAGQEIPFSFPIAASSEVTVKTRVTATGVEATLSLTTDYSVTINGDSGGTVTLVSALAATSECWIIRNTTATQSLDLTHGSAFSAESLEDAFDKAAKLTNNVNDAIDRALVAPDTDPTTLDMTLPNSVDRASQYLAFTADGEPTVVASVAPTTATITTWAETLLDDASAAAARTTLGIETNWSAMITGSPTTANRRLWKAAAYVDHVFDVRDYGAAGDGVIDDSTAIQAAIHAAEAAGGGVVKIPRGNYDTGTTGLTIQANSVWLVGDGHRGPSVIQYSGTGAAISIGSATTSRSYCGVQGIYLVKEGTARETGSIGIRQYGGQDCVIRDSWIALFEKGILFDSDSGDLAYIVGDNLDNVRLSGCMIGLEMESPITALFARAMHIVGPGKTESGSYGIKQASNCGQGNYFSEISIETCETAFLVGGNQQNGSGIRIEACTYGWAWASNSADNCTFSGCHVFATTTAIDTPPAGADNNHIQYNGEWKHTSDGSTASTNQVWLSGAVEQVSEGYAPGASGYLRWRKVGVGDILRLNYADQSTEVMAGLKVRNGSTSAGYIDLYEDRDVDATAYVRESIAIVDLTNAQLLDLAGTPVELVAAPGAGKWIEFCGASLWLDYTAPGFTEPSSPDDLCIEYDDGSGPAASATITASGFITATADTGAFAIPVSVAGTAASAIVNKNLAILNTGTNWTNSGGSVLRVIVRYRIHSGLGL